MKIKSIKFKPARIEMVPLIDSFFLILVYFILAFLSMSQHHGIPLDLPQSETAVEEKIEHYGISVGAEGDLYWNQINVTLENLFHELESIKTTQLLENIHIYIYGDDQAPHGMVIKVLDVVRRTGLTKIFMETESV